MYSKPVFSLFILVSALLTGCANTAAKYQPIVDGEKNARFDADLQACQEVATQRSYLNDDVKTNAILGAGIGALVGAAEDGVEAALGGAVLGATAGGAGRSWETREERKAIVIKCMQQRGHPVVG